MGELVEVFVTRGDLAHIALFLWAASSSGLLVVTLRELAASQRRFDAFIRELAVFNHLFGENE